MNKIICDICGTTYPGSSECCPICGCSSAAAAEFLNADIQHEDIMEDAEATAGQFSANYRKKEIFDYDEVNQDSAEEDDEETYDADEEEDYEAEEEEESPRHNTFAVILLTVLIVVLLGVAGFIFVRFFLPNMGAEEAVPETVEVMETEMTDVTTEATVPCQHMAMTNAGIAELSAEGQQFLLHIKALPENTTDKIIYTSGDESIATVTEDGKITAVSEGETVIYISCGVQRIDCPVIVKYVEETEPPVVETVADETVAAEESEETEVTTATEANPELKDVKLKLKRTDIQLGVYYSFQLELDCALTPEEVTWSSEHPHIATVDAQGNVTAVKEGTTSVTAKYGDQEVQCMVRCIWY